MNISDYIVLPSGALPSLLEGLQFLVPTRNGPRLCYAIYIQVLLSVLLISFFSYCRLSQMLTVSLLELLIHIPPFRFLVPHQAVDFNFIILNTLLILRSFIGPFQLFRAQGKNLKAKQVLEQLRQMQQHKWGLWHLSACT